ncbi:MAG: ABC transporter substrate-binding protein [Methylobacterium frigidaeris]
MRDHGPEQNRPSRRAVLALPAAGLLRPGPAPAGAPLRVACLDYGLAQTLIAIGHPPVAIAAADQWPRWVVEPPLPPGVANLGTSREVNLEILHQLRPDLIVATPFVERLRPLLARIAPVESHPIQAAGSAPWSRAVAVTRALGARLGADAGAEALVAATEEGLRACAPRVARLRDRPVLVVAFQDARNVWVYGADSLYDDALRRLGLVNGWSGRTNAWGFASVGVEALAAAPEARLVCLDPMPADALRLLAGGPIWRALGFSGAGRLLRLPAVLAFGTLPSVTRFARLLAEAAGDA